MRKSIFAALAIAMIATLFCGCANKEKATFAKSTGFIKDSERVYVLENIQAINAQDNLTTVSKGSEVIFKRVEYPNLTGGIVRVYGGYIRVNVTPSDSQIGKGPFAETNVYFEASFFEGNKTASKLAQEKFVFKGRYTVGLHVGEEEVVKNQIIKDMQDAETYAKEVKKGVSGV